ncbi:helix-turn-helix domain-containing protein [Kitasatospora sp. NPDC059827]|uniref:helix-turn-helix domain-containing protein n=1 Tax=Kitasatospora sp. NPDC059827 TaxID=3346964 RepID=UPI0036468DFF
MASVHEWTGLEAAALRKALRLSVRGFAQRLGVAERTISKWEALGAATHPRPDTQAILDTALSQADAAVHLRFETELSGRPHPGKAARVLQAGPRLWDYESWAEDIERAAITLSRQNFGLTEQLLSRWLTRWPTRDLDDKGLYLFARSTTLVGDLRRDQGALLGSASAHQSYSAARTMFAQLEIPRRIAQIELSLAVVTEMSGQHNSAAGQYEQLTADDRLSRRDRARARLWVGTALSKNGNHDYAASVMQAASRDFEDLSEVEDWSVAQQKLALAHRGAGDLSAALHFIDIARSTSVLDSPMQRVRLDTAHGHILLSDPATTADGLAVLAATAELAAKYGMSHQLQSIDGIRRNYGRQPALGRR